jgi:hypothetical protein
MTERSTIEGTGLGALEQVLERFGSDRTRWPAPVRRDFAGLLASSAEAKARLREAEALDRLLDLAPEPEIDARALADRIVAAAAAERPAVVPPEARAAGAIGGRAAARRTEWPAAALLAASLVLGMFVGLNGAFDTAVAPLVAQVSADADIDPGQIAFGSDGLDMFEEDLL